MDKFHHEDAGVMMQSDTEIQGVLCKKIVVAIRPRFSLIASSTYDMTVYLEASSGQLYAVTEETVYRPNILARFIYSDFQTISGILSQRL